MLNSYPRPLWLYPLFQIPLLCLGISIILGSLFYFLGLGRPLVGVAIMLDLSGSTYNNTPQQFNQPETVIYQEVQAVEAYLEASVNLRQPNQIQVFGFGGAVESLTDNFQSDASKIKQQLAQALQKASLAEEILTDETDIDLAIQTGIQTLQGLQHHCRELLLITDGEGKVSNDTIKTSKVNQVKINAVVIGKEVSTIRRATVETDGIYLLGNKAQLEVIFANQLFDRFNSNLRWVIFWSGLGWIALMWLLALPLDRWLFQGLFRIRMDWSGKLALYHALFWSALTPFVIWQMTNGFPFLYRC